VIFAGAGILLLVAIVLGHLIRICSDSDSTQAAKDVLASQDTLIDIFERIENFFRRLEEYTEVPTTEAMKDIIVKIMVEVFGIFAIVTKEMKQGRASELIYDDSLRIVDKNSEKYLKTLFGRRDIEDALSRLDRLTQEEARMATAQVLKVAHRVKDGAVVDDCNEDNKFDQAIEGTLRHVSYFTRAIVNHIYD
jgi:ribosomal protein S8